MGRLPVDVTVTINVNETGEASDTLVSGFTYTRGDVGVQPVIFSVTPNIGPNEGGTRVTINGDGFQSPVQVTFEQGSVRPRGPGRVGVAHAAGGDLAAGGGLRQRPAQPAGGHPRPQPAQRPRGGAQPTAFRYGVAFSVFAVDPSSGPFTGGTRVTIFGEGFDEPLVVDFGDVRQQVLSVTGNEILVRTAALRVGRQLQDVSLPVLVTHLETNQTAQGGDFTYLIEQFAPNITSTTPSTLSQSPGQVTINGSNFRAADRGHVQRSAGDRHQRHQTLRSSAPSRPSRTAISTTNGCDDNQDNFDGERFVTTPLDAGGHRSRDRLLGHAVGERASQRHQLPQRHRADADAAAADANADAAADSDQYAAAVSRAHRLFSWRGAPRAPRSVSASPRRRSRPPS